MTTVDAADRGSPAGRAIRSGNVDAVARPLHVGRTVIVIETEVCNDDGKLVAKVTQSQAVLRS